MKKILCTTIAALTLSACVNPERVSENKVSDTTLDCQGIANELAQISNLKREAKKGTGLSGANVAAVLVFWPAAIGNYANGNEALKAAEKRENVLINLAQQRKCKISGV